MIDENVSARDEYKGNLKENVERTLILLRENMALEDEYKEICEIKPRDEKSIWAIGIRVIGKLSPAATLYIYWKLNDKNLFEKVLALLVAVPAAIGIAFLIIEAGNLVGRLIGKRARNLRIDANGDKLKAIREKLEKNTKLLDMQSEIPQIYRYTEAVETFLHYIECKRAESLKEAINLYEWEWQHKERLNELKDIQKAHKLFFPEEQEKAEKDKSSKPKAKTGKWLNFHQGKEGTEADGTAVKTHKHDSKSQSKGKKIYNKVKKSS